ncbi:ERMES complex subunit mmm1 [Elasticomyces elasticus]|uniref:Maintenance of mitochondrial morphology protein 1 n=1 Tax=Exophiala sideris TaxID=1016849 RepID=A0ABR0J7U4_9EURO|nr:ERMES complex subunit mmm1 [Elasticomyces elasticus]KAK5031561.1 ERMES complex subunit mmm1 [Exophiala sideris]KAK5058238.1 ERMES complex subunit mmm1 [Exophiala sideris]KAK5180168.1 ERMES complex subunit mmm1 [Eurotiomycetes sp. CCFEE 6388]
MSSDLTFTQGLIIGQLSVALFIAAFIKFFIFGEAPPPPSRPSSRAPKHVRTPSLHSVASSKTAVSQSLRNKASASNVLRPVANTATDIASILRKTYYQIPSRGHVKNSSHSTHQPESLDWFNVLLAQTIAQYRQTAYNLREGSRGTPTILASLEEAINDPAKRPSYMDKIKITEISMGEEFPIFSNVRVTTVDDDASSATGGRLQALMDVDLADDNLTLAIETALILNYPKPFSAVLPVALAVSVVRFSGTLSISFVPATQDDSQDESTKLNTPAPVSGKPKTNLAFSFLPDYRLDLSVRSLIGSRTRLQDVPKIAQLIEARAQAWFEERVVEPRVQVVPLPGLWPRMGKVRVREGQDDERPPTQDEHRASSFVEHRQRRSEDSLPSQEETERIFEGLRLRTGHDRLNSQVFENDGDLPTPQGTRMMPGALPA